MLAVTLLLVLCIALFLSYTVWALVVGLRESREADAQREAFLREMRGDLNRRVSWLMAPETEDRNQ